MSEVTIKWLQRVAGYEIGDEVTVERTAFIDAVIATGRVEVIGEEPVAAPRPGRPKPSMLATPEAVPDGGTEAE